MDSIDLIPCDICDEYIKFNEYNDHSTICNNNNNVNNVNNVSNNNTDHIRMISDRITTLINNINGIINTNNPEHIVNNPEHIVNNPEHIVNQLEPSIPNRRLHMVPNYLNSDINDRIYQSSINYRIRDIQARNNLLQSRPSYLEQLNEDDEQNYIRNNSQNRLFNEYSIYFNSIYNSQRRPLIRNDINLDSSNTRRYNNIDEYANLINLGETIGNVNIGIINLNNISSNYTIDTKEECFVCREDYENGYNMKQLLCSHFFCEECFKTWFKLNKKCPICMTEYDEHGYHDKQPSINTSNLNIINDDMEDSNVEIRNTYMV